MLEHAPNPEELEELKAASKGQSLESQAARICYLSGAAFRDLEGPEPKPRNVEAIIELTAACYLAARSLYSEIRSLTDTVNGGST